MGCIEDGISADHSFLLHCSSYHSSAEVGSAICVHHPPLVDRRTGKRVKNEEGVSTGPCSMMARTPSLKSLYARERFLPNLSRSLTELLIV